MGFIDYHNAQQKDKFDFFKILVWEAARSVSTTIINWSQRKLAGNKKLKPIEVIKFSWDNEKPMAGATDREAERKKVMKKFKIDG